MTFNIIEVPERLKVSFRTNMLIENAEAWWSTLLEVKYRGDEPRWEEFAKQFRQAYLEWLERKE